MKPQFTYFSNVVEAMGYLKKINQGGSKKSRIIVDPLSSRYPALAEFEGVAVEVLDEPQTPPKSLANQPIKLAS